MAWVWLVLAGLFEVVWAMSLKYTEGFTRIGPSLGTLAAMAASIYFLALGEPSSLLRLASIGLIVAGIAGLKLAS